MLRFAFVGILNLALFFPISVHAADAAHIGRHESTPEDLAAINQVIEDFQSAIINKDGKQLSTLIVNSRIPFFSPGGQETIDRIRETRDVTFDGVPTVGFHAFSNFVSNSEVPLREEFYNIQITQDGHLAWVMFDFEFIADGKIANHGVESWQLLKVDGMWKIFSVVWSSHGTPK